jgi:UDP:flavonoid glycosyltransferase YjiC (YdhE family)
MRILLAWELGGNYGHISKLLCIARHIRQRGHQVFFVVKDTKTAGQLLDNEKFRYVQSPRSAVRAKRFRKPVSFTDILAGAGFGSPEVLDGLVLSWQEIFENMHPHVVVAQYAPVAQFAARLSGLPCLSLNNGFESPPDEAPFPCLRSHLKLTRDQLLDREAEMLQHINRISLREGHFSCNSLQEVFKSDINLLATFPEMDHYRQRRNGCYIGPISMLDNGATIRWRARSSPRIFVYLRPFPGIEAILEGLAGNGAEVIAHIPGLDDRIRALYTNTSLSIVISTIKLSEILADMDVAITHAGHGTACAVLLAGVPLLMIPTTIEQWLTSCNIEALGAGISMKRERVAETFVVALEKLLADHSYREGAKNLATKYAGYDQGRVIARIVNTIERLPGWVAGRMNQHCPQIEGGKP